MTDAPLALRFDPAGNFQSWRKDLEGRLRQCIGILPEPVPLNLRKEFETRHDAFTEIRFVFSSENNADVPCHLLLPHASEKRPPVVICLQGHTSGMHISLGRAKSEADEKILTGGRDFALQAVAEGFAALVLEQRCFGERADQRPKERREHKGRCTHAAITALLLGRTMIGQRVFDVSRAIDALEQFPQVDHSRIACMGNSGGGTITWYASCLEPRIKAAMPSCAVCSYQQSIGSIDHCVDNYLPGALQYFDMHDLAGLIAPRPLLVVAGQHDAIFPIEPTTGSFQTIQKIYAAASAPDQCKLVVGPAGHQFYPAESWPQFRHLTGW